MRVVYIVELSVETDLVVSEDQLGFTPILSQGIERSTEVTYLVGFIVRVVNKSNLEFREGSWKLQLCI